MDFELSPAQKELQGSAGSIAETHRAPRAAVVDGDGDAQARAQALDQQHHAPYPGPAVPSRFVAALVSTEDHRFYSEPGIDAKSARTAVAPVSVA